MLISEDATTHLAIAILGWAFGGVFTAGGFYIYVRMSISNLEKWGQTNHTQLAEEIKETTDRTNTQIKETTDRLNAEMKEVTQRLNAKIDKNYETLDFKIDKNEASCKGDLSGIGGKVSRIDRDAARRHHNITQVLLLVSPQEKEEGVSKLLKEEVS